MNKTQDKQIIHFFTGKGGVGKSVMASSKAMSLAATGASVLLVELEGATSLKEMMKDKSSLFALTLLKPIEELKALFAYFFKFKKVGEVFFNNAAMVGLVNAAPGLKELASLGKLTSLNRKFGPSYNYNHIVVDAYSTGHFINWLNVPMGMSEVIKWGPMGEQCRGIAESLKDKEAVNYYVVINPEKAIVDEGLLLCSEIKNLTEIDPIIILNKKIKDIEGEASKSLYVSEQIKDSVKVESQLKKINSQSMPFSFKKTSYEQSKELSSQWK